jgi:hypothetical protein
MSILRYLFQQLTYPQKTLQAYLALGRNYRFFAGMVEDGAISWQEITDHRNGKLQIATGREIPLGNVRSYLVAYPNGEIADSEKPFSPLPPGIHMLQPAEPSVHHVMQNSDFMGQPDHLQIWNEKSPTHFQERNYYKTCLRNTSRKNIRILRFAGYHWRDEALILATVTNDFFTEEEFHEWYGVDEDGWIKPEQTVFDPSNYGLGDGCWVYFAETEDGEGFVAKVELSKWL